MATTALYDDFYSTAPDGEEVARQPPAYSFFDPNSPRGGRNPRKTPTGLPPLASRSSTEPDDRTGPPGVDVAAFEDAVADSDAAPEPAGYVSLSSSCTSQPEPRGTAVNLEQRYSPAPHGQPPAGFQAPGAHRWAAPLREAMDSRDGMGPQRPVLPDPPPALSPPAAREPPASTVESSEPLHQRQPPSTTALEGPTLPLAESAPSASMPRPAAPPAPPAPSSDASAPSVAELLQLSADVDAQRSASASSAGSVPSIFACALPASAPAVVAPGPPNPTTERSPTRHPKASLDRHGAQEAHYTAVLLRHEVQLLQRRIATLEREATAAHGAKVVSEERADAAAAREATWQARCAALEERLGATTATLEAAVAENTALRQAAAKAPSRDVSVQCALTASAPATAPGATVRPPEERGPEDGGAEVTPRRPHERPSQERPSRLVSPSLPAALEGPSPSEPSPAPALRSADPPVANAVPAPAPARAAVPERPEPPLSSVPPADAPLPRTLGTPPRSQRGSPRADDSSPREGSGERPRPSGAKAKAKEELSVKDLVAELQAVQEAHTARERMLGHRVAIAEVKAVLADRRADAASRSPSSSPQRLLPPATRPDASPGAIPPSATPPATPERKPTPARTAPSVPAPAAQTPASGAAAGPEAGSLARTLLADLAASRRSRRTTPVATHSVSTSATPPAALATPGPMPHGASGGRSQSSVGTATGLPPPTPPTPGTPSEGRYDEYLRSVRSARTVSSAPSAEPHRSRPRGAERGRPPTGQHATGDAPQRREVSPPMPHGAFHGFRPSVTTAAVHEPRSSSASSATAAVFVPSPEARPRPGPAAQSPTTQREAHVLDGGQGRARSVSQGTTASTRFATPGRDRVAPAVPSWRPADTSRTHSAPSRTPDRGAGWLDTSPASGDRPRGDSPASDESWTYTYDSGTETAHETPPRGVEDSAGQRRTLSPRFPGGGLTSPAVVGPRPAVASPPRPGGVDIGGRFNAPRRSATPASDRFRPR